MEKVYLVYYRYDDDKSMEHPRWWVNWLAYKISQSVFIHVEMVFEDGEVYGIGMGGSITKTQDKSYSRDRYTCQEIYCSSWQVDVMRSFLDSRMEGSAFNYTGFLMLPLWPISGAKKNRWFCSELISSALAEAGFLLDDNEPQEISPGHLFEIISSQRIGEVKPTFGNGEKILVV